VKPSGSARLDRLEAAVRTLAVGLAGLAGSLERELGAAPTVPGALAAPLSSRLEKLIAGRIAVPVKEVGTLLGRGHSYVYREIGRGALVQVGPGKVSADSLAQWYARFEKDAEQRS
jgi:hypothetical protein